MHLELEAAQTVASLVSWGQIHYGIWYIVYSMVYIIELTD